MDLILVQLHLLCLFLTLFADLFIVLFTMVDFLLPLIVQNVGSFDVAAIFRLLRMFRAIRALRALRVLRTIRLEYKNNMM